jgi:hypothetical protein
MGKQKVPTEVDHALLAQMGLQIEGPGAADAGELAGCYWWTWYREGWGGIECGAHHPDWQAAVLDAWRALWNDPESRAELRALSDSSGQRTPSQRGRVRPGN